MRTITHSLLLIYFWRHRFQNPQQCIREYTIVSIHCFIYVYWRRAKLYRETVVTYSRDADCACCTAGQRTASGLVCVLNRYTTVKVWCVLRKLTHIVEMCRASVVWIHNTHSKTTGFTVCKCVLGRHCCSMSPFLRTVRIYLQLSSCSGMQRTVNARIVQSIAVR